MIFSYPNSYENAFKKLFEGYLLIPHEHYEFGLKGFGKISSVEDQNVGNVVNRVFSGKVASEGGLARRQDQDDQNFVCTRRSDQIQTQVSEDEDPSIEGYDSDKDIVESSKEDDDFIIIL